MRISSDRGQGTRKPRILQLEVTLEISGHIPHFTDKETKNQKNQGDQSNN